MAHTRYKRALLSCLWIIILGSNSFAQNADSLFTVARQKAFRNKDYHAAIMLAKKALAKNPAYVDIIIFTGRVYAWNKQADSAELYFKDALQRKPDAEDAYLAYTDLEYWNHNYEAALSTIQTSLSYHPNSVPLLLRKAKVLSEQRAFRRAILVVDTVLQFDKNNTEARVLASLIRDHVSKNRAGIKYDYVSFDKQFSDPWHFVSLDYTRQTMPGPFTARINYANRFSKNGLQYELESYPVFSKIFYAYFNIGYSDNTEGVFPKWRAGTSIYMNLPKAFEAELGMRYLYFSSNVFTYTAYLGKYYKNFLFGARTYLTPSANNIAPSYSVMTRYYYGGIDDYIGLNIGTGISPDDRSKDAQLNSTNKLHTYQGELTARHAIKKLNIVLLNFSFQHYEYRQGLLNTTGNQLQGGIGYIRRF